MVTAEEAYKIVHSVIINTGTEELGILNAVGRVLAESIHADRDFPPFNRVSMDGIAICAEAFKSKGQEFLVEDVQAAGSPQLLLKDKSSCIEVMTGAVLPANTDSVVRYEDLEIKNKRAAILIEKIDQGMNVHSQGQDVRKDEELLKPGMRISSAEVALLASVGKKTVRVKTFPKTAVISSGDELVGIEEKPDVYQIRRSNTFALQAAMSELGWKSESFHLTDDKALVKKNLQTILENDDVLILSGGISKGKFDFIPEVLEELGIQKIFHQVSQRPGKPFWFGASADKTKVVFALPGNPVSTFMCFYRYIKPWILQNFNVTARPVTAKLAADVNFSPALTYFLQVHTELKEGTLWATPHAGGGSGDFANLKDVDGFLELPLEKSSFKKGEVYPFIPFRGQDLRV